MRSGPLRWIALGAMVLVLATAGIAHAVSGGGYDPSEQDCPNDADAYNAGRPASDPNSPPANEPAAVPGCHNFKLNVEDGSGHRYAEFGIDQIPNGSGENAHSGSFEVNTNDGGPQVGSSFDTHYQPVPPDGPDEFGLAFYPIEVAQCLAGGAAPDSCVFKPTPPDPSNPPTVDPSVSGGTPDGSAAGMAQQFHIYLGADDNLDTGEHDGVDGSPSTNTKDSANGPSDGGAVVVNWHPMALVELLTALASGDAPTAAAVLSNPVPVADAGFGMCADGICASVQTAKRVVYQGGSPGERDVYNYDGKVWDPEECSSGSLKDEKACSTQPGSDGTVNKKGLDGYRQQEKTVVAEPGVQVYEDPDAEGSPIGPYPLTAAYVGTCGVAAGGGPLQMPASPVTNSAGQVIVSTGC